MRKLKFSLNIRVNVMRRSVKKIKLIFVMILMVFTLVASNTINHYQLGANSPVSQECLIVGTGDCRGVSTTPSLPTPMPEIIVTEQDRFLAAIAPHLSTIPQVGSYEYILLRAYGAAFINQNPAVQLPATVLLQDEPETLAFQETLTMMKVDGTNDCYLQASAATALNEARSQQNIPLKSGYGSGDCTRSFATNLRFWYKYANRNTLEQVRAGKETAILGVVAPPGTSQHLWGLAIDLRVSNAQQRQALYEHGWFQTVAKDVPHWTYLGVKLEDLPQLGLKQQVINGISYWLTPL